MDIYITMMLAYFVMMQNTIGYQFIILTFDIELATFRTLMIIEQSLDPNEYLKEVLNTKGRKKMRGDSRL
jgi:hypothetical protein